MRGEFANEALNSYWTEKCAGTEIKMHKKMILAASFGTSYLENGEKTIGAIERVLQDSFPEYEVKRAFTSKKIIAKLKKRDGIQVDTVLEALR